jgi:N-acetylglucosaminyl-diphospho-decaprenol L-rhamnosyltransferase
MLAIQIVNYRTRAYLERCVATVVADVETSGLRYELNLLDNASGEDLDDFAAEFDACRTFTAPRNLGFGGGHNLLANQTQAPYLLILNPDVEFLVPDSVKRLLDVAVGGEGVAAVGPKLITSAGSAQPYDHGRLRGLRAQIALRGGHSYWHRTDVRQQVAWVSGAAMAVERAAFTRVGGFDENLFLYKEDEDLCLALRRDGGRVIYEPAVVLRHQGSVVADRQDGLTGASAYFFDKHYPNRGSQRAFAAAHRWLAYVRL